MARKRIYYFLFSKNKKALYVDANGFVQETTGEPLQLPTGEILHLKNSPIGWKDTLVKVVRNIKWWGLLRDITVPMKFPKDGAKILRNRRWTFGIECVTYLGLLRLDPLTLPYKYENWYTSELNYTKFVDEFGQVSIEALEGGLIKFLKAYESTVYNIDITNHPNVQNVLMDGMEFDFNRVYQVQPSNIIMLGASSYYLGMIQSAHEGESTAVTWQDILFQPGLIYPNEQWLVNDTIGRDYRVHGSVKIFWNKEVDAVVRLEIDDGAGSGILAVNQYELIRESRVAGTTESISFDITVSVPVGNRIYIKVLGGSPTDSEVQFTVLDGEITFDFIYKHPSSINQGLYPLDVAQALVDKMTEGQPFHYVVSSRYLSSMKDLLITSGDSLRGFNPAILKTSMADFFQSMFATKCIYLSVETNKVGAQQLRIEKFEEAFIDSVMVDLGEVEGAKISEAEDLLWNTIRAGYETQTYTDVNGKFEFNQGQDWNTIITRIIKKADMTSKYRMDPLGIELLRINFEQAIKPTTDTGSDNDTFMLNVVASISDLTGTGIMGHRLYRPPYSAFTGLPHWETSFNTEYTPHKNLLRCGAYLHSILDFEEGEVIKFIGGDKNTAISTTLNGVTVTENEDIQISNLPAKLFRPNYITFNTRLPFNLLQLIKLNPYKKVRFRWNDQLWTGFISDVGLNPATNAKQSWKLISSVENNLINFNA